MQKYIRCILFVILAALLSASCALADTLRLPEAVTAVEAEAFLGDTSLEEVLLPEGLTAIGDRAFAQSSLTRVYLPESLTEFGKEIFAGSENAVGWGYPDTAAQAYCEANGVPYEALSTPLEEFTFTFPNDTEATLTGWDGEGGIVVIPDMADETHRITAIGNNAFKDKTGMTAVRLPKGLVTIYGSAFQGCANLEDVVFHEGLKLVEHAAFYGCVKLKDADLPDSVEYLGSRGYSGRGVFQGCTALESFHYPASLQEVYPPSATYGAAQGPLCDCPNLKTITFGAGVTAIVKDASVSYTPDRVWVAGHSRGAAVANILGGKLLLENGFRSQDIYAACFACPNVVLTSQVKGSLNCSWVEVYNIEGDIVPRVPCEAWGYGRYGREYSIDTDVIRTAHHPAQYTNESEDIARYVRVLGNISSVNRKAFLTSLKNAYEKKTQLSVDLALTTALSVLAEANFDDPDVKLQVVKDALSTLTSDKGFIQRLANSHNNNTYVIWMATRYPDFIYHDYLR